MTRLRSWLGLDRMRNDDGIALVMVIGIGAVLAILMVTAVAYTVGGMKKAGSDQNWNAALAAAYAGIEEYQSQLANDTTYMQYGNPGSSYSGTSSVVLPPVVNPAFGNDAAGTWAVVPGSGGEAQYRYEVDNSEYGDTGNIHLRSTGKVGDETRTIVADLRQQGFIDFLYFTDYEIKDPDFSGVGSGCVKYAWAGRSSTGCHEIAFGGGDRISGPVHSNDTIRICDATFEGKVTTANNPASGLRYTNRDSNNNNCANPVFHLPTSPEYSRVVGMPATNSQLKKETRSDLGIEVPRPGCLFTGPTSITFSANGNMTVRSPWTIKTNVTGTGSTGGSTPARCGTPGVTGLGSSGGQTFAVPANNVIYVQNVPSVSSDVNYWPANTLPSGLTCKGLSGSRNNSGNTSPADGNGIGYPTTDEKAPANLASSAPYGCRNGDVFVRGTLDGTTTVAAENYGYVVGNLQYEDSQDDMLGLIGNNAVFVWNPIDRNDNSVWGNTSSLKNRRIDAAIISVGHTFQVQNYGDGGERGTLTVTGAIAQKFRGVVSSGSNGYVKDYNYDLRLRYTAPPKFLSPVTTTYGVNVWVEVSPAFNADGTPR